MPTASSTSSGGMEERKSDRQNLGVRHRKVGGRGYDLVCARLQALRVTRAAAYGSKNARVLLRSKGEEARRERGERLSLIHISEPTRPRLI
eukprot:929146-Rhodomonas_salina.2